MSLGPYQPSNTSNLHKPGGVPRWETVSCGTGKHRLLPEHIDERLVCASPDGTLLYVAEASDLKMFSVEQRTGKKHLVHLKTVSLGDTVICLACARNGEMFAAVGSDKGAALKIFSNGSLRTLTQFPATPRDLAISDRLIFALLSDAPGLPPQLLGIDRRSGRVETALNTNSGVDRVKTGPNETAVLVDSRNRLVRTTSVRNDCRPDRPPRRPGSSDPVPAIPDGGRNSGDCNCNCHPSPGKDNGRNDGNGRPPGPGQPPRRPPPDDCRPGDDGIDEGCIRYVAIGAEIVRINVCDPNEPECRRPVHARIERIEKVGGTLLAVTERGRGLLQLDPQTLAIRQRQHLRVPVGALLATPATGGALMISRDGRSVTQLGTATQTSGLSLGFDLEAEVSESVIEGVGYEIADAKPRFATDPLSVLVVPVIDPDQGWVPGTGVSAYDDALHTLFGGDSVAQDAPITKVLRYYDEQSNNQQTLTFETFGLDTPDMYLGDPVMLPAPIQDYYHQKFEPGGLLATANLGTPPAFLSFSGEEERNITAVSSVNAGQDENEDDVPDNHFDYTLRLSAGLWRIDLENGQTLRFGPSGSSTVIDYIDRSGTPQSVVLNQSGSFGSAQEVDFDNGADNFVGAVEELRSFLQVMLNGADTLNDFAPVDVVWGKFDNTKGRIYIRFAFAPGPGATQPRITNFGSNAVLRTFFDIPNAKVRSYRANFELDPSGTTNIADEIDRAKFFLDHVILLAEIEKAAGNYVQERILSNSTIKSEIDNGDLILTTAINMATGHGGAGIAKIITGGGMGADPLNFATADEVLGNDVPPDDSNTPKDYATLLQAVYSSIAREVDTYNGGAPGGDWEENFIKSLKEYDTIYIFPVDKPPASNMTAWSVNAPERVSDLRAFVFIPGNALTDTNGLAPPLKARWGMNFQSFDAVQTDPDRPSPLESDTRTFGHELGHSLGLGDQYPSEKFSPALNYIGSLDIMGSSQANWPHLCAYHKLAMGWWSEADRLVVDKPAEGETVTPRFILAPTERWESTLETDMRAAFPNEPNSTFAGGAVICDTGGDGSLLAVIEARAPGEAFSKEIAPDGELGRVTVFNVLDYGETGRYAEVVPDLNPVSNDVADGLLRFRRRIHSLATNLQSGDAFDLETASGFPVDGLTVTVEQEASITIGTDMVPIYLCTLDWTPTNNVDVGFSDNELEWRSSDLGIDYTGGFVDPDADQSGESDWPIGQPTGTGDHVVIPEVGSEPHQVMVRVWNFGKQTARQVVVDLYLRDPGGGGDVDKDAVYATQTIEELRPEDEFPPTELRFDWSVPEGQEPHVCWRAQIREFQVGEGASVQTIVSDGFVANNWVQQNIFETDVVYSSPPEPLESRFSVHNGGPFVETAFLEAKGLPKGVTLRVRPRELRVPAFTTRRFHLRFEFDEALIQDPCHREMEVLLQCWRRENHSQEQWGASQFRINLREKTETTLVGQWLPNQLSLNGAVNPPIGIGTVALRIQFQDGRPTMWVNTNLNAGGTYDTTLDIDGFEQGESITVTATYTGSRRFAPSTSPPRIILPLTPAG